MGTSRLREQRVNLVLQQPASNQAKEEKPESSGQACIWGSHLEGAPHPRASRWEQAVALFTHVHVRMSGMIARPAHHHHRVAFSVPLRFKPETCPSQALLEPRMAARNKRRGLSRATEARSISYKHFFFWSCFQMNVFFGGGVRCSKDTNRAVCQLLMVQSRERPGHLRLAPDNEYDEDG